MKGMFALVLSVWLAGCALSPQQVTIAPAVEGSTSNIGEGRTLSVEVVDARESTAIGSRGGMYRDTSLITPANDMAGAVREAAVKRFRDLGFKVLAAPGQSADIRIFIDTLRYRDPDTAKVGFEVELDCVLRAEVRQSGDTYNGRYRVRTNKRYATVPGVERNEEMINEVLSGALKRLFDDPKLLAFTLR